MASKTYAELIADGLRQSDETSGSGSATAKMIVKAGINESYAEISAMRDWETLENEVTVPTVAATAEYTPITGSTTVPKIRKIQYIVDQSNNRYLAEVQRELFERDKPYIDPTNVVNQGNPTLWYHSLYDSNRDMKFKVWQVPSGVVNLLVHFIEDPIELVADADIPRIPDQFHYGLPYLGIAKYFEYQKDPIASYYRQMHEAYRQKVLAYEYQDSDDMPAILPNLPSASLVIGKLGRIWNK